MSTKTVRIEVSAFMTETEKAVLIRRKGGGEKWVPLSLIPSMMRKPQPSLPALGTGKCGWIEVERWWADKEGLLDE